MVIVKYSVILCTKIKHTWRPRPAKASRADADRMWCDSAWPTFSALSQAARIASLSTQNERPPAGSSIETTRTPLREAASLFVFEFKFVSESGATPRRKLRTARRAFPNATPSRSEPASLFSLAPPLPPLPLLPPFAARSSAVLARGWGGGK